MPILPIIRFQGAERDRQERLAKQMLKESGLQSVLARECDGAYVWKLEKQPHWLVVRLDWRRTDPAQLKAKLEQHREKLQALLDRLFKDTFQSVFITTESRLRDYGNAGCCGTGCAGCLIQRQQDRPGLSLRA